jgi:hypothetical protein
MLMSANVINHRTPDHAVEITVKGQVLVAHRNVLSKNSEYFARCLSTESQWAESKQGAIVFDDIEPKYMALFIGVAYSHTSIAPLAPPVPAANPLTRAPPTAMVDFVEVYKLCDRFISTAMADYMTKCIKIAIIDNHRSLFRSWGEPNTQRSVTRDFADGYEALEMNHPTQHALGDLMIAYFCAGVNYETWSIIIDQFQDRPNFIAKVSGGLASLLHDLQNAKKLKRKELVSP